MKILGLIPARGGSKGIPKKNIKLLNGRPLLEYTFNTAKSAKKLSRVILSSEDSEIMELANKIGLEVPFTRPQELAGDTTSSLEVIRHCLEFFEAQGEIFDAICLLQPTTPFREKNLIDSAITKFIEGSVDSLISVRKVPVHFNPHWVFLKENGKLKIATGEKEIIKRRQELPPAFYRDGAIYITKTDVILKSNSLYGENMGYIENTTTDHINIDSAEDWKIAEDIITKKKL